MACWFCSRVILLMEKRLPCLMRYFTCSTRCPSCEQSREELFIIAASSAESVSTITSTWLQSSASDMPSKQAHSSGSRADQQRCNDLQEENTIYPCASRRIMTTPTSPVLPMNELSKFNFIMPSGGFSHDLAIAVHFAGVAAAACHLAHRCP